MKLILTIALSLLSMTSLKAHPLHFSITSVDYSDDSKSLQISAKLFSDDLLDALKKDGHKEVNEEALLDYFSKNFQVKLNEKDSPWAFIGFETEEDVTFVYLEIASKKPPKSISIMNTLILNLFEDQTNVMHLDLGTNKYTFTTNLESPEGFYPAN
ncbi:hypothetical protein KFE98_12875 [bacterium SCSIO 12741]|nr:hypothetical protein KFE98_12875 [bacterium SCSIO 12741]